MQKVRWPVLLLAMAVTFGALMGGNYLFQHQTVESPLRTYLADSPMVESFAIERGADGQLVKVRLAATDDLQSAHADVDREAKKLFGPVPYRILIEDNRTPELQQLYRRMNLFVQEGLATGQFSAMADRLEQEATAAGVTAVVSVDNDRVYMQLHEGEHFLYSVIERPVAAPNVKGGARS